MKNKSIIFMVCAIAILIASCKKKFDTPPKEIEPAVSGMISIDSVFRTFKNYYVTATVTPTKLYRFGDVAIECLVTADEASGNLYKSVYVEDATGALKLNLMNSGGVYIGDKIRIHLNNLVLNDYGDVIQIDSVDVQKHIYKVSSGNIVTPTKITFSQVNELIGFGGIYKYQSRLILLDSVEFVTGDKGETFADALNKETKEITLQNNSGTGGSVIVRNSGYSNFASSNVPCGKGSLVAIHGQFGSTTQLTLRDINDVKLSSGGCPLISKSFNDNSVTSKGWTSLAITDQQVQWVPSSFSGQFFGKISGFYSSTNHNCETWLISPAFDLSNAPNPFLTFQTAYNYSGPALQVYVLTNYSSGNPASTITGTLSPALSGGSWNWVQSGNVSLSSHIGQNKRIAFKYTGTSSACSTWEIDDIAVFAE